MTSYWGDTILQLRSQRKKHQDQVHKITKAINVLKGLDGNEGRGVVGPGRGRKRRKFSAATKKKMAAAQRARWAKVNA